MKPLFKPRTAFYINLGLSVLNGYMYSQTGSMVSLVVAIICLILSGTYIVFPPKGEE